MKYNFECNYCRDRGRINGCPKCGKTPEMLTQEKLNEVPIREIMDLGIPEHYINNAWNKDIILEDRDPYIDDPDFLRYVNNLTSLYEHLCKGGTVGNSALVSAPIGFGKTTWVYNCIIELKKHNYNVPPLINTSQLKSMRTMHYERPTWKNVYMGWSYTELLESDVLFVNVTKSTEYVYAARVILDIVDVRAKYSKPTVVISDWSISSLLATEETGMLLAMLRGGRNVDPNKFLIKIEFSDYKSK